MTTEPQAIRVIVGGEPEIKIVRVLVEGQPGPRGPSGTKITVSETEPENPEEGEIWIDIS